MVDPRSVHWIAVKHILRYIKGTMDYGLVYECRGSVQLAGFTYVDCVGCVEDRKSTSSCCFNIGSGVVSWFNTNQNSVALNSVEAKYMAAILDACEGMWLRKLLPRLFKCELEATVVHYDKSKWHQAIWKSSVPWPEQTHWYPVLLPERLCTERNHSVGVHSKRWVDGKYFHQGTLQTQFCEVQRQVGVAIESLPRWEGVLESGNKESLLALHVFLHARETLNRKPNVLKCFS